MTPLYQDTKGPSQHVYAYSQEMGSLATKSFFQNPLLSLKACLGPPKSELGENFFFPSYLWPRKWSPSILRLPLAYTRPLQLERTQVMG